MRNITIIGIGRLGGALAIALDRSGHSVIQLVHRSAETARLVAERINPRPELTDSFAPACRKPSDIILIATGDQAIAEVAEKLVPSLQFRPVILHTSGALSSDVLEPLAAAGCHVGSLHPLISVSDPLEGSDAFENAYFCLEGDQKAVEAARSLVASLHGRAFSIATDKKTLYHAAAVMACGHVTALIDIAAEMMLKAGVPPDDPVRVLMPLIESTIKNIDSFGTTDALTGSFARGDAGTVRKHLEILARDADPHIVSIYKLLGERSLRLADLSGFGGTGIAEVRELIS